LLNDYRAASACAGGAGAPCAAC